MFQCNCPHEVRSGCSEPACPHNPNWRPLSTAPRDGTFIRLQLRGVLGGRPSETVGQWQGHDEMSVGGSWFDREGNYITPAPIMWQPEHGAIH